MSFTPNLGPVARAVYVAFGVVLIGLAWWGPVNIIAVSFILTLVGAVVAVEGAVGF